MKCALILLSLLLCLAPQVTATETLTQDGVWWQALPTDTRVAVVEGMLDAYSQGFYSGYGSAEARMIEHIVSVTTSGGFSKAQQTKLSHVPGFEFAQFPVFSKTMGTYVDGINDFYSNHPEAIKVSAGAVLGCLADRALESCEKLAKSR